MQLPHKVYSYPSADPGGVEPDKVCLCRFNISLSVVWNHQPIQGSSDSITPMMLGDTFLLGFSHKRIRILQQLLEPGFRQQAKCMHVQPIAHCHPAAEASPLQGPQQVQSQHGYLLEAMLKHHCAEGIIQCTGCSAGRREARCSTIGYIF